MAARGIDIAGLPFVIQFPGRNPGQLRCPKNLEDRSFVVCSLYITVKGFMYSNLLVDKGIYEFVPSRHKSEVLLA